MLKRSIALVVMVIMIIGIGLLSGCESEEISTDRVFVSIKEEYKEKFLAKEFSVEDFEWSNVDKIEYREWYSTLEPESGRMIVYLKKHGKRQVKSAKAHFETLVFVSDVSFDGIQNIQ